ncbi:MAG: hypothetical protein LBD41_03280 [Clostridiales Family XIII bacterium]|jgi:hypothetical protein|nr:hypothetical protein [Clostridiales Family XIII bacterium]
MSNIDKIRGTRYFMSDSKNKASEKKFDREAFFKEIRGDVLKKLGLPANTRPENVLHLIKLQGELDKINVHKKKPS